MAPAATRRIMWNQVPQVIIRPVIISPLLVVNHRSEVNLVFISIGETVVNLVTLVVSTMSPNLLVDGGLHADPEIAILIIVLMAKL